MRRNFQVHFIIPAARRAAANEFIVSQIFNGKEEERDTFPAANLSTTGAAPGTHAAASLPLFPALRQRLQDREGSLPVGVRVYVVNAETGNLARTNSATAQASVGQVWSFEASLADLGLQRIQVAQP